MSIYVIGKFIDDNNKTVAYKLYNSENKAVSELYAKQDIKEFMLNYGVDIVGLNLKQHNDYYNTFTIRSVLKENKQIFNMDNINILDCYGNQFGDVKYILIGVKGFGDNRVFKCIDSDGKEYNFEYQQFLEKLNNNSVVGAILINDKIAIYKKCKNQIYS